MGRLFCLSIVSPMHTNDPMKNISLIDHKFMERALELASLSHGEQRPNPFVGALVVKRGKIISEGFHSRAGGPHAEIVALKKAGARAQGATLYVTLEPCCHQGRTGPCTSAIISAGISRVVYALRDPNPQVAGKGLQILRRAGIKISGPILAKSAREQNYVYLHWRKTGLPFVTLKVATSLDGKIADSSGKSQWITNAETRNYVHKLRATCDAILVGNTTVTKDNPSLTVRLSGTKKMPQPVPIIWCGSQKIPWLSQLINGNRPAIVVIDSVRAKDAARLKSLGNKALLARTPLSLLKKLAQEGVSHLLIEGGAYTAAKFMKAKLINRYVVCLAPKLLGGKGLGWTDNLQLSLTSDPQIQVEKVAQFGDNVVIEGRNYV